MPGGVPAGFVLAKIGKLGVEETGETFEREFAKIIKSKMS
jgi:hypothetical protein